MNIQPKTLISTSEVAALADVDISTVSNWRKRFVSDFPSAQLTDDHGKRPKFDRAEVLSWLDANPRLGGQRSNSDRAGSELLDALRNYFPPFEAIDLIGRLLVVAEEGNRRRSFAGHLTSDQIRQAISEPDDVTLRRSSQRMDTSRVVPDGVLEECYEQVSRVRDRLGLYDSLLFGRTSRASVLGEHTTPVAVSDFILALLPTKSQRVFDPAAGYGDLLKRAIERGHASSGFGIDINVHAVAIANRRFFLAGVDAEVVVGSSLTADPAHGEKYDLVLVDPPLSMQIPRGDRQIIENQPWMFKTPSMANADFAWLQHAVAHLNEGGRAIVVTAIGALFRMDGPSASIRAEMIRRGAIEAVIALPGGTRQNTGSRLAVWVLRTPDRADRRNTVLLVDAGEYDTSNLGPEGNIAPLVRSWLDNSETQLDSTFATAVPVTDLLAPDATLMPNRWTQNEEESFTPNQWRDRVRASYEDAQSASQSVGALPTLEVVAAEEDFDRVTLGELQKAGKIQIIKGRYAERAEDEDGPSFPMLTVRQVRPGSTISIHEAEKVPQSPATAAQLIRNGDVVIYLDGSAVKARVWREDGWVLGRFMQIVRTVSDDWVPEYVAGSIGSPANERFLMGTAIKTHFKLAEFQLVRQPVERQRRMAEMEQRLFDVEEMLAAAAMKVGSARDDLVQALTSGVIDLVTRR